MSKTVQDLTDQIEEAQSQIREIQRLCAHSAYPYELVMYSYRPGAWNPTRLCSNCKNTLPGITSKEEKKIWDEWNTPQTVGGNSVSTFTTVTKSE